MKMSCGDNMTREFDRGWSGNDEDGQTLASDLGQSRSQSTHRESMSRVPRDFTLSNPGFRVNDEEAVGRSPKTATSSTGARPSRDERGAGVRCDWSTLGLKMLIADSERLVDHQHFWVDADREREREADVHFPTSKSGWAGR